MRTVFIRITGKVQGVFYRATARDVAESLRLSGWVRNCADGAVEALASGAYDKIEEFIQWCHRGPEQAVVERVVVTDSNEKAEDNSFRIRR
ncbi:MAG: acylphosphatase [Sphingobacteriales bacterium]|nr:MAG: acylphosphatase [Sphingobacteriales bacterium]